MKIRTDFVTNSSSSSFTVEISIHSKNGIVEFREDPYTYGQEWGEARFVDNLMNVNSHLSSVEALAKWLADSVRQPSTWKHTGYEIATLEREKTKFINDAKTIIKSVRDIDSIVVERHYSGWGEGADLIAENDRHLKELAAKYLHSSGIDKERAEAEMVTYIHQTTTVENGEYFEPNSVIRRYNWSGHSVKKIAEILVSDHCISDKASGVERQELNLKTGEYFDESEFDLN